MNKMYYAVNNWLIDLPSGSIISLVSGEKKRLGEYQLKLLDVLVTNAGKILTREELTTLVWERRVIGNNSLPNAIHALRSALEDDGKAQKIIKTIPKKGYLLEPAWCRSVELESEDTDQPASVSEPVIDDAVVEEPDNFPALPETSMHREAEVILSHEPLTQTREPLRNYQPLFALLALLFVVLASAVAGWHYATSHDSRLVATEQEPGVYSNINIYAISEANQLEMNKEDFYSKIKDTLYIINQQIKSQSATMTVYYQSVDQTLNYTFALKNRCGSKQLVMAIYHWRIDPALLNNLILRETRRKISEMETCT
ncbi:transcriptional regulator [Scandinavium sp. V105_16]|uniref:Transcriptional regulator n=1 Tax=Scandinavium lactucae TaxID=3095028 RepID=A0AAJ2S506_9ENTR|nr:MULTISPECIES: transcriptional regulator [unclassified Scandinavium]MDX6020075.1 transcriptional regulator [Scandinavium sp. V105_16]MDX6032064.1 transcriptional regulator [Scandinavium sp. V105_12]